MAQPKTRLLSGNRIVILALVVAVPFLYASYRYAMLMPSPTSKLDSLPRVFINTDMHSHTTESDG